MILLLLLSWLGKDLAVLSTLMSTIICCSIHFCGASSLFVNAEVVMVADSTVSIECGSDFSISGWFVETL